MNRSPVMSNPDQMNENELRSFQKTLCIKKMDKWDIYECFRCLGNALDIEYNFNIVGFIKKAFENNVSGMKYQTAFQWCEEFKTGWESKLMFGLGVVFGIKSFMTKNAAKIFRQLRMENVVSFGCATNSKMILDHISHLYNDWVLSKQQPKFTMCISFQRSYHGTQKRKREGSENNEIVKK